MKAIDCSSYNGFVKDVTEDCLSNLTEENKEYIREHPYAIDYHFGYAMYIRNHYIYNNDLEFEYVADDLSGTIMNSIISKLTEYDSSDAFYWRMFDHKDFLCLRREYKRIYGAYPIELIEKYHDKYPQDYSCNEMVRKYFGLPPEMCTTNPDEEVNQKEREIYELIYELAERVWNIDKIKEIALHCGIVQSDIERSISKVKELFVKEKKYIPMSSVLLPHKEKIGESLYDKYRRELLRILDDTPDLIEKVDKEIFHDRQIVKELLKHACALKQLPDYQNDDEIAEAMMNNSDNEWQMYNMSDRIKKKYGISDED